jgi:hypothetical protein
MRKRTLIILLILAAFAATATLAYAAAGSNQELATIRQATARYHDLNVALADGYEPLFDCTVNPNDPSVAMGQHYINGALAGDDLLELEKPEVLMYERQNNGRMKLVGVEYVVFEEAWSGAEAPTFLGRTMARKTAVGLHPVPPFYEIHAWVWTYNPNGSFADWNPNVTCP